MMDFSNEKKKILTSIAEIDNEAFIAFSQKNPMCHTKEGGDWLFPALFDFYTEEVNNEEIMSLLVRLGNILHEECISHPFYEILGLDKSLCLNEYFVYQYIVKMQNAPSEEPTMKTYPSPYKTKTYASLLKKVDERYAQELIIEYGGYAHPYILADIANCFVNGNNPREALKYIKRSLNLIAELPNRFWNSELAVTGAINTLRLIRINISNEDFLLSEKIFKYCYLYITRLIYITHDDLLQQTSYVNRAELDLVRNAYTYMPFQNNELMYISDMYYAHFCNETAQQVSILTGNNYYQKSLTFYQNGSLYPNDSDFYRDATEATYSELVRAKNQVAIHLAMQYYKEIESGNLKLSDEDIESIFDILEKKCVHNIKN